MDLHQLFERFGVVIVFINALLHELALPIPLTPTVLLAGAASPQTLAFFTLVLAIVAGTVIGNALWFAAGRRFGGRVLGFLCRFSLSPDTCVARSAEGFGRWGASFFIIGRFVPGVSLVAPPVAGALGMSWARFLTLTVIGATLWAVVVVLAGAALQPVMVSFMKWLATLPAGAWLAIVLLVAGYVLWRFEVRRRARRALEVPRLSPEELRLAMHSGEPPLVIDVRGATMQQIIAQRIPGALSLSLDALRSHPLAVRRVVLYCNCPNEASAAAGVRVLQDRGQWNVHALRGGLAAWIEAGYEVETMRADLALGTPPAATDVIVTADNRR